MSDYDPTKRFQAFQKALANDDQARIRRDLVENQEDDEEHYLDDPDVNREESQTQPTPLQASQVAMQDTQQPKAKKKKGRNWQHDETMALIHIWELTEVLYKVTHPDYYDNTVKKHAIERLVLQLKEQDIAVSVEEATAKMHSLRVYFGTQRNKLNDSKKSGAGANEVYQVTWPFFQSMMFLNDNLTSRHTTSNLKRVYNEENIPVSKKSLKKIKEKDDSNLNEMMGEALNAIRRKNLQPVATPVEKEKDSDDLFFEMLAKQFKNVPNTPNKEMLKLDIHRLVVNALYPIRTQSFNQVTPPQPSYLQLVNNRSPNTNPYM